MELVRGKDSFITLRRWFFALLLCATCPVYAANVGLMVDAINEKAERFKEHLDQALPNDSVRLVSPESVAGQNMDFWVSTSVSSLDVLLNTKKSGRVLALFLNDTEAQNLRSKYPSQFFTYLSNTPSLLRQMALIKAMSPHVERIGLFYSRSQKKQADNAQNIAKTLGFELLSAAVDDPLEWDRNALTVLKQSDIILGIDDPDLYNPVTVRGILMRLYRSNRALVGPDKAFVKAGAVASVYSGVADTLKAAVGLIRDTGPWPAVFENPYYQISTNEQVARSLHISLDDENNLKKKVEGAGY